ncbi:MAG: competence protein ComEC [Chloroflexota bacterium]|jgi:competence protein ComEC|nr:competence protein ComEC [Chloroflexota bacterium]
MPRAGWLACGAIAVAMAGSVAAQSQPGLALAFTLAVVAAALAVAVPLVVRRQVRTALFTLGLLTVGVRLAVGMAAGATEPPPGPVPTGSRTYQAEVGRLGSTDGGMQRALLAVVPAGPREPRRQAEPAEPAGADPATSATAATPATGPWTVYAWLPRYPVVAPGDRIEFAGTLEPLPDGPGFGDALRNMGAVATVRLRAMAPLPPADGIAAQIEPLRRAAGERLAAVLPQREAGLASGILVGLRDLVDRDVAATFTTAGLSHVVAISGWNIAQVAAVIVALLRWLPRRPRSCLVIAAIVLYTLLAGASASVIRAAVMGAVCLLARESGRRGGAASALALCVWLLLLADPVMVTDVGFQLSSVATAGLLAWATPLQERLAGRVPRRVPAWLVESMAVSLAAQASTLPLVLFHFGRLSLVSPLANLLAAPLIAPVMLLSLVALTCGSVAALGIPAVLLAPAILASWLGLAALIAIANVCAALPFASVTLPQPIDLVAASGTAAAVFLAGTATGRRCWSKLRERGRRSGTAGSASLRTVAGSARTAAGSAGTVARSHEDQPAPGTRRLAKVTAAIAAAFLLGTVAVVAARPDGRFRVTALDIGQGDSILLEGDRGARVLIDGGPDPDLLMRRLDGRIPTWDRRLDLVVLSHPHEDHAAGLPLLFSRYSIGSVAETGMLGNGPGARALRTELSKLGVESIALAAGDHLQIDDASATVLWPRAGEVPLHPSNDGAAVNNVSIVLDVRFGSRRFLLTGDVQEEIDPALLAGGIGRGQPPVDVLKVAHHGSATASSGDLLAQIQPRVAFVSAGVGNPYGHPAPSTIDRLRRAGADVYRTDTDGDLTASSDGTDLTVSISGSHAPRPTPSSPTTQRTTPAFVLAFSCAIPTVAAVRTAGANPAPAAAPPAPSRRRQSLARVGVHVHQEISVRGRVPDQRGSAPTLPCYDRPDDRPIARRGRGAAARAEARSPAPAPHDRRGRDRRVPRRARRRGRARARPQGRRDRGTPARPGQGAAGEGPAPPDGPRLCRRALARGPRVRRAGAFRRVAPRCSPQ